MRRLVPALVAVAAACSGEAGDDDYTVLAAASLTAAFEQIGERACCPTFSFGPSSAIVHQVAEGAPVDVVATADAATMDAIAAAGVLDGAPVEIARNHVVLVVPAGNPARIGSLADVARGATLAVCAGGVPCGKGAARWLEQMGAGIEPTSLESDVKAVLTKVELGEVDAGIVYRTDALAAADTVEVVDAATDVANSYFIALVDGAPDAARGFVDAVRSEDGIDVLTSLGFATP